MKIEMAWQVSVKPSSTKYHENLSVVVFEFCAYERTDWANLVGVPQDCEPAWRVLGHICKALPFCFIEKWKLIQLIVKWMLDPR